MATKTLDKQNVFLTGVTGFVGRYLLYQLCEADWIDEIYVLIRPKKGVSPKDRFAEVLKDPLYKEARKEGVTFDNIHVISGDVQQPKLGMCEEDLELLSKRLTLVIHNAAALSFAAHLHDSLKSNTSGSWELYQMCCNRFALHPSFVFVSTVATNSHMDVIPEEVTEFSAPAQYVYDYVRSIDRERATECTDFLKEGRLDGYGFAKGIAERMIYEDIEKTGGVVPVHFIRPGGIISAWGGPLRGWLHDTCFYAQLGYFVYNDSIPFFLCDRKCELNMAPVDYVGNMVMCAALENLEKREKKDFSVQVVNGRKPCVEGVTFDVILDVLRNKYFSDILNDDVSGLPSFWQTLDVEYKPNAKPPKGPWYIQSNWVFEILYFICCTIPLFLYSFVAAEAKFKKLSKLGNWLYKYVKVLKPYLCRPIVIANGHCDVLHERFGNKYSLDGDAIGREEFVLSFLIGMGYFIVPYMAAKENRYKKRLENAGQKKEN